MNAANSYAARLGTLEGALELIRSGDTIATSMYGDEPTGFLSHLHTVAARLEGVTLWTMLMMGEYPVMTDTSLKGRIDVLSFFYNPDCRAGHASGRYSMVPMNLHIIGKSLVASRRPTVFATAVSPPDEEGNVYFSFDLQGSLECMEAADRVIFEINPNIPRVLGETAVPLARADYIYERATPLPELHPPAPTETERRIAAHVSSLIKDGDCLQLGIGGIPNAMGDALTDKRDLGIHTEMITASMGMLMRNGVITNARKTLNPGRTIGAFALGDHALYEMMRDNPSIQMRRAAYTNDPFVIAQNDNMVSVNTAIEIDLTGQICSESIGGAQFSGTGGASDFAYGAYHARGGRGIIALPATAKGGSVSKIVSQLTPGAIVSISRNLTDCVVTEYGIARLRDRSVRQRVEALIDVAAPEFRAELRAQADRLMLW